MTEILLTKTLSLYLIFNPTISEMKIFVECLTFTGLTAVLFI